MSAGQLRDWHGERGSPWKEELLVTLETLPFEVAQKTDAAKLGITTLFETPPPNSSVHQTPKKHL